MTALVILGTTAHSLTATAYTFTPDSGIRDPNALTQPQSWRIRAWSPVPFHIAVGTGDATTSDAPVDGGWNGLTVVVPPGGTLSAVKQAGASDSTVWFSRIKTA
jgi:hypothetical protein